MVGARVNQQQVAYAPITRSVSRRENYVRAAAVFLSGAHPVKKNEAHVGATID